MCVETAGCNSRFGKGFPHEEESGKSRVRGRVSQAGAHRNQSPLQRAQMKRMMMENGWVVCRGRGRFGQRGTEKQWEQGPSTPRPKERRKLVTLIQAKARTAGWLPRKTKSSGGYSFGPRGSAEAKREGGSTASPFSSFWLSKGSASGSTARRRAGRQS